MNNDLETVAAFFDGERVDTAALKRALSTDEGRDYLVELVAMREVISAPEIAAAPLVIASHRPRSWRGLAAAAAVALAVGLAGYALGANGSASQRTAPAPNVVVTASQDWQEVKGGN